MSDAEFRFAQDMRALLGDRSEWLARHAFNDLVTERGQPVGLGRAPQRAARPRRS